MKRIGILRETKIPVDNRTPITPAQCKKLLSTYPGLEIYVQPSCLRVFPNEEYIKAGAVLSEDMASCDWLFGVKEVSIKSLIPDKHYFFFAHIGKMQPYNQNLCRAMIEKNITLTDYEYLTKEGKRLVSFSFWAGVMGVYNSLRLYGLRHDLFDLPAPDKKFSVPDILNLGRPIISELKEARHNDIRILITGNGRASAGAQFILNELGVRYVSVDEFLTTSEETIDRPIFTVAMTSDLVKRTDGYKYDREHFKMHPNRYYSDFGKFSGKTTIFIPCHFWAPAQPKYLTKDMLGFTRIDVVGDVTCDINGSVETTVRPSTHDNPFYGIDRIKWEETDAMSDSAIGVMAVDTLPNAIPVEASTDFGEKLMERVFPALMNVDTDRVIERATLIRKGELTAPFSYLKHFAGV